MSRAPLTRRAPPRLPRHPDAEIIADAIRRLTTSPDWPVVMQHLQAKTYERFLAAGVDTGALLEVAIRNTVIRELEQLGRRVTDDDRSNHE